MQRANAVHEIVNNQSIVYVDNIIVNELHSILRPSRKNRPLWSMPMWEGRGAERKNNNENGDIVLGKPTLRSSGSSILEKLTRVNT